MPRYIFRCEQCDGEPERPLRYAGDEHVETCPVCGEGMHRAVWMPPLPDIGGPGHAYYLEAEEDGPPDPQDDDGSDDWSGTWSKARYAAAVVNNDPSHKGAL